MWFVVLDFEAGEYQVVRKVKDACKVVAMENDFNRAIEIRDYGNTERMAYRAPQVIRCGHAGGGSVTIRGAFDTERLSAKRKVRR